VGRRRQRRRRARGLRWDGARSADAPGGSRRGPGGFRGPRRNRGFCGELRRGRWRRAAGRLRLPARRHGPRGHREAPDDLAPVPPQKLDDRKEGNRCRRYAKQIARFEGELKIAEERENDVWKQVTEDHLKRLRARKEVHCPEPEGPSLLLETVRMLAVAAKVAAKLYTWGAF